VEQEEVLEHSALFVGDRVIETDAVNSNAMGSESPELLHTLLLQGIAATSPHILGGHQNLNRFSVIELDLSSINVDFGKRLTGRSGVPSCTFHK